MPTNLITEETRILFLFHLPRTNIKATQTLNLRSIKIPSMREFKLNSKKKKARGGQELQGDPRSSCYLLFWEF